MLPLVLSTLVDNLGRKISGAPIQWVRSTPSNTDLEHIQKEGAESQFDPLKLRATLLKGNPTVFCRDLYIKNKHLARVLVVCEKGSTPIIPWLLYSRIFQAFGVCTISKEPWRVVLFAASASRLFPEPGVKPEHEHLNGGYAYPGVPSSVVIYRQEESYRVLIHELLHACGSDNMNNSEWKRESFTETWAELFLIAILAKGSKAKAQRLWEIQSQWIADQEFILTQEHGVTSPDDYAYRYTIGRRDVLKGLGLPLPPPSQNPKGNLMGSLRFTSPMLYS